MRVGVATSLAIFIGSSAAAQRTSQASLPACRAGAPESFPCRTPFDQPPALQEQPHTEGAGERKTPRVWVFVTATGEVTATQIERSAGFDWDLAAVSLAKRLRFKPAVLDGQAVAVWYVIPVTATASESCSDMAVPLSAGYAIFVDSQVLERPELGTAYRYRDRALDDLAFDVFIYPRLGWPPPEQQGGDLETSLEVMRARGDFASYEVQGKGERKVKVRSARLGRDVEIRGYAVRFTLRASTGEEASSYFAVFPQGEKYIKFRVTYDSNRRAQRVIDDVVWQVLSARAAEPAHCPE